MAGALAEAERDLLAMDADLPEVPGDPEGPEPDDPGALLEQPKEGALAYFAGERRGVVSGFVRMGRAGELEATQHRS
jgi:hypothetical protein